jgi:hypothetical protein
VNQEGWKDMKFAISIMSIVVLMIAACSPETEEQVEEAVEVVAEAPGEALLLKTKSDMNRFGLAIEQYIMLESGRAPQVNNIKELADLLTQGEYLRTSDRLVDGWGNDLIYEQGQGSHEYRLISLGADGARGGSTEWERDIIWEKGEFIQ